MVLDEPMDLDFMPRFEINSDLNYANRKNILITKNQEKKQDIEGVK
jgi:hypothetical protein